MQNQKIRVLHVLPFFLSGGVERLVIDLMEHLDKERFEVAAVSLFPKTGSIFEKDIEEKKLKVYYLNLRKSWPFNPLVIFELYKILRTFQPHVVHMHRYGLTYGLLPVLLCRVPARIYTMHGPAEKDVKLMARLINRIGFRFGGVLPVCVSQRVKESVIRVYGKHIDAPVIYNGINTSRFLSVGFKAKSGDDLILLHIGRFHPEKNHFNLITGFELAVKEYSNMQLWLVGDGPLRVTVEKAVKEKRLEEKVRFLGVRSDIPELMAQADIFLLPSDYEGLPLTLLEAMAAGKPVIATDVAGSELIIDNQTGLLVPVRSPEALAKAILYLAKNPSLREQMGRLARKVALENFDISRMVREYESLYMKTLEEKQKKLWRK